MLLVRNRVFVRVRLPLAVFYALPFGFNHNGSVQEFLKVVKFLSHKLNGYLIIEPS